jgi:hypothetical protein
VLHGRGRRQRRLPPCEVASSTAGPDLLHHILDTNARAVTAYLNAQIEAGAQAVMVFDTWGGSLSDAAFREFSLEYSKRALAGVTRESGGRVVPRILVQPRAAGCGSRRWADSGADALGIDWQTPSSARARRRVGDRVALQGNFDPMALFGKPASIRAEVGRILAAYGSGRGTFSTSATRLAAHCAGSTSRRSSRRCTSSQSGPRAIGSVKKNICVDVIAYSHGARSGQVFRASRGCHVRDSRNSFVFGTCVMLQRRRQRRCRGACASGRWSTYSQTYPQVFRAAKALSRL